MQTQLSCLPLHLHSLLASRHWSSYCISLLTSKRVIDWLASGYLAWPSCLWVFFGSLRLTKLTLNIVFNWLINVHLWIENSPLGQCGEELNSGDNFVAAMVHEGIHSGPILVQESQVERDVRTNQYVAAKRRRGRDEVRKVMTTETQPPYWQIGCAKKNHGTADDVGGGAPVATWMIGKAGDTWLDGATD